MATVRIRSTSYLTGAAATIDLSGVAGPGNDIGDVLVAVVQKRRSIDISDAGWTTITSNLVSTESYQLVAYKIATGADESFPSLNNGQSFTSAFVTMFAISGLDTSSLIDASVNNSSTGDANVDLRTGLSTTATRTLLIEGFGGYSGTTRCSPSVDVASGQTASVNGDNQTAISWCGWDVLTSSGAVAARTGRTTQASQILVSFAVAFTIDAAADLPPHLVTQPPFLIQFSYDTVNAASFTQPGDILGGTYDGATCNTGAVTPNLNSFIVGQETAMSFSQTATGWGGAAIPFSSIDLTDSIIEMAVTITSSFALVSTDYLTVGVSDSLGNWATWQTIAQSDLVDNVIHWLRIDLDATPYLESATPVDITDLTHLIVMRRNSSTSTATVKVGAIRGISKTGSTVIVGGGAENPVTIQRISELMAETSGGADRLTRTNSAVGGSLVHWSPIQIGDGSIKTVSDMTMANLAAAAGNSTTNILAAAEKCAEVRICTSSNDVLSFADSMVNDGQIGRFIIDPASVTPASTSFAGMLIANAEVFLDPAVDVDGARFIQTYDISAVDATATDCAVVDQLAGETMTLTDGADISGTSFQTETAANYALTIAAAGTFTLNGCTFTGYTTDINVTASTGTVTIGLAAGDATPTYTSAGATVTFVTPAVNFVNAQASDGARYQLSHQQVFDIASTDINATTEEITLGNDSNGDAAAFDVSTSGAYTLVCVELADGATIPTTVPQIVDGGCYRAKTESSGVITLSVTEGGTTIAFTDAGTNNGSGELMTLRCETSLARGVVSGGSGFTEALSLSDGARVRRKAIHYDETSGQTVTSVFFDDIFIWSAANGATDSAEIDNVANPWADINRIADVASITLGEPVANINGTVFDSVTPSDTGSTVAGLTYGLEGTGKIQVNAADADGFIVGQDLLLWMSYIFSTEQGLWLSHEHTLELDDIFNASVENLEVDETSGTFTKIVGVYISGIDVASATTGSVAPNVATRGNGAVINVAGSSVITGDLADVANEVWSYTLP